MGNIYELANIEINKYCTLDVKTGEKKYSDRKMSHNFTGLYYENGETFFALYPSETGPKMFCNGREYLLHPGLSINIIKSGVNRTFCIPDYGINIKYKESPYLGMDAWSDEMDVDLFYMISVNYKMDDFYEKYTLIS